MIRLIKLKSSWRTSEINGRYQNEWSTIELAAEYLEKTTSIKSDTIDKALCEMYANKLCCAEFSNEGELKEVNNFNTLDT